MNVQLYLVVRGEFFALHKGIFPYFDPSKLQENQIYILGRISRNKYAVHVVVCKSIAKEACRVLSTGIMKGDR